MNEILYQEEIQSTWTTVLFAVLDLIFLVLFAWQYSAAGWTFLSGLFLFLGVLFAFYFFNYRTLRIRCDSQTLSLEFGLIRWRTDYNNIEDVQLDDSPWFIKYGGAGVHFAMVRGTYRALFNFLEYPRLAVELRKKQGLVQGLSFTTQNPDQIREIIQERQVRS